MCCNNYCFTPLHEGSLSVLTSSAAIQSSYKPFCFQMLLTNNTHHFLQVFSAPQAVKRFSLLTNKQKQWLHLYRPFIQSTSRSPIPITDGSKLPYKELAWPMVPCLAQDMRTRGAGDWTTNPLIIGQPALHQWFLACWVSRIPSIGDEQAGIFTVARERLPNCVRQKQFNGCTLSDDLHFLTCTVQISRMEGCEQDQWQKWFFQKLLTIPKTPATRPALSTKAVAQKLIRCQRGSLSHLLNWQG